MNSDLSAFNAYVSWVEDLALAALRSPTGHVGQEALANVFDGQAAAVLRETVPLRIRRKNGAFFSDTGLRATALGRGSGGYDLVGPVLDPAMGAGDLLIEYANQLPANADLECTLKNWGSVLHGRDIEPAFIRLAKARLILLAASKGAEFNSDKISGLENILPGLQVGDGLQFLSQGWSGKFVFMNPPFTLVRAPDTAQWSSGRISLAATFLATVLERMPAGTSLTAILPDVIRSGSIYDRLRSYVETRLNISRIEPYGRFDPWTDVDVFILSGVIADSGSEMAASRWWRKSSGQKVGDHFVVSVGNVVPYRDEELEPIHPFLHARAIPLGGVFDTSFAERRGFQNQLLVPPFVAVRRTSRPGDRSRGLGTLIKGTEPALVENHLIILKPLDGSVDLCRRVIDLLASDESKQWLDERIRCRHLTVRALRELPWSDL